MKQPRQTHLDWLEDEELHKKFKDIQSCIISSKTEEQVDKYTEQMKYCKQLIESRGDIVETFTSMGKQRCSTWHEWDEW